MIDILVIRGDGSNPGPAIQDPMLSQVGPALERGRVEIDKSFMNREESIQVPYRPGVKPGQFVQVVDSLQGISWKGIVSSVDMATEGPSMLMSLTIMRSV